MSTFLAAAVAFTTLALAEPGASTPSTTVDPPKPSELRWRLHADVAPFTLSMRDGRSGYSVVPALPGPLSIGFGHTVGRYVLVGTRFGAELRKSAIDYVGTLVPVELHTLSGHVSIHPYVEIRPLPDRRIQPIGVVEGGVQLDGIKVRSTAGPQPQPHRSLTIDPSVGGRVGLRAFVLPRLSIDADLGLRRYWSYAWRASPAQPAFGDPPPTLQLAATVGLSGWW